MKIKRGMIIGIIVLIFLIIILGFLFCPLFKKEKCELYGGRWGHSPPAAEPFCDLPTSDAGKECSDQSECDGDCLAELTKQEEYSVNVERNFIIKNGTCSDYHFSYGGYYVREGKVRGLEIS